MDRDEYIQLLMANGCDPAQAELIGRIFAGGVEGDKAAISLFAPMFQYLRSLLRSRLRDVDDANECLARTNIEVVQALSKCSFRGESQFRTWYIRIAINVASKYIKERMRIREHEVVTLSRKDDDSYGDVVDPSDFLADKLQSEPNATEQELEEREEQEEQNKAEELILKKLQECIEQTCRDLKTGKLDPLRVCLTQEWIKAVFADQDATITIENVAEACGTDTARAFRQRKRLETCLESKGLIRNSLIRSAKNLYGFVLTKRKGRSAGEKS